MGQRERLLERLRRGHFQNVNFGDFCDLLEAFGFRLERSRGSHFIYAHPAARRSFPIQPMRGSEAKPAQLKEFLRYIDRYNLTLEDPA